MCPFSAFFTWYIAKSAYFFSVDRSVLFSGYQETPPEKKVVFPVELCEKSDQNFTDDNKRGSR